MNSTESSHARRVLVTGGAVRIGAEIVRAFAVRGIKVVFTFSKSRDEAAKLLGEIGGERAGHRSLRLPLDKKIPENLFAKLGQIDILVNNASSYPPDGIAEESQTRIEDQLRVNLIAPIVLSRLFSMQNIRSGSIINLLDCRITGLDRADGSYWLSKKALDDATEMLAVKLAPRIRVNAVAPGAMLPPSNGGNFSAAAAAKAAPLGKLPSMKDLTNAIIFLVENESITGQTIFVDSGRHLNNAKLHS